MANKNRAAAKSSSRKPVRATRPQARKASAARSKRESPLAAVKAPPRKSSAEPPPSRVEAAPAASTDPRRKLTGGEIVAEFLIGRGVPWVTGIPGRDSLPLLDALVDRKQRISVLPVLHEQSAVHLADAYFRVAGKPLAVVTAGGNGTTGSVCGVRQAWVNSSAVMLLAGSAGPGSRGGAALPDLDRDPGGSLSRVLEPLVKGFWQVGRVDQLPAVLQAAYSRMMTGRCGPVLVELPLDLQAAAAQLDPAALAGGRPEASFHPDPVAVDRAARLLARARRPVILAGGGVLAARASRELQELAEHLGAPVTATWMGKGSLPENHPLYAWQPGATCADELLRRADVLLALGTQSAKRTQACLPDAPRESGPPAAVIQVDIDSEAIGGGSPADVAILADARAALAALLAAVGDYRKPRDYRRSEYFREIQKRREQWLESFRERRQSDASPISISRALRELREILKPDTIVVTGAGLAQMLVCREFPVSQPRTHITSAGFATPGFTVPGAIGAQLAAPRQRVVGIAGDGDFLVTARELSVAVQQHLPVVYVVFNNCGWQSVRQLQVSHYGYERAIMTEFQDRRGQPYTPNFAALASAFGAQGERIDRPTEIHRAVRRALDSGCPSVVEMMTGRQPMLDRAAAPAEGGIPVPGYLEDRRRR